jgi:hypothetical protein
MLAPLSKILSQHRDVDWNSYMDRLSNLKQVQQRLSDDLSRKMSIDFVTSNLNIFKESFHRNMEKMVDLISTFNENYFGISMTNLELGLIQGLKENYQNVFDKLKELLNTLVEIGLPNRNIAITVVFDLLQMIDQHVSDEKNKIPENQGIADIFIHANILLKQTKENMNIFFHELIECFKADPANKMTVRFVNCKENSSLT